jgi:hypothetical protein
MGQQPTKGPSPHSMRKQPAPLKTSAWEWWTTGYFDETPEQNGITKVTAGDVSSWVGKIQGLEYEQTNGTVRPEFKNDPARGFKCPSVYFDFDNTEHLEYANGNDDSLIFMHDGTGGTFFVICANDVTGTNATVWTSGGSTSAASTGFTFQFYSLKGFRTLVMRGDTGYATSNADNIDAPTVSSQSGGFGFSYSTADGATTFYDKGGATDTTNTAETNSPTGSSTQFVSHMGTTGQAIAGFTGHISDVVIWNRVLTESERQEMLAWAKHRIKE